VHPSPLSAHRGFFGTKPFSKTNAYLKSKGIGEIEDGKAAAHQGKGWEEFTDKIIHVLNEEKENLVFILWGSYAQKKASFVDRKKHLVLEAVHPSPLSAHRGFFGTKPFSKTNAYLKSKGIGEI
ncbi:uracil-DNA glycosylase family protein, partial [Escherichia coli]|uniref:uracil-DNA glycosylase family protein n=1 Tax=Escherichia coli TaxID=562 RepID=UPI0023DDAC69